MARAGGLRQHLRAVHMTGAEALALDVCRVLDGEPNRPQGMATFLVAMVRRRLQEHAQNGNASIATQALAVLDLSARLIGEVSPSNRPPAVLAADPRTALEALRDLADRRGDLEAASLARAALGDLEPQERVPAVGDVFLHRDYQWSNGDPRRCVVLEVGDGDATFACLDRTDRRPVKARHRVDLETFEAVHLGRWVQRGGLLPQSLASV